MFERAIREAKGIDSVQKVVHFAGGEPMLYFAQLNSLAKVAAESGFSTSIVTNGFWGKNGEKSRNQILELAKLGLYRAELSYDVFHQEYISPSTIESAIRILKDCGVEILLRVVTTKRHTIAETIRLFSADILDGVEIASSPMVPVGRAASAVGLEDAYLSVTGDVGSCHTALNLTIRPDGNVSPCCAGSENTPCLSMGNLATTSLKKIVENIEWNFLIKKLVYQGPSSFFGILKNAGLEHKIDQEYTNICHACTKLFNDEDVVSCIRQWIGEQELNSLAECFRTLLLNSEVDIIQLSHKESSTLKIKRNLRMINNPLI